MLKTAQLETSLTFAVPNAIRVADTPLIDETTFANPAEHIVLHDRALIEQLRKIAMQEMAIGKVAVGSSAHFQPVEFFWIDVKRDKKVLSKLKRVLSQRWIKLVYELEAVRDDVGGDILAPELTPFVSAIERWVKLRRFILEGTNAEVIKKKKRSILLFHDTDANAPNPE